MSTTPTTVPHAVILSVGLGGFDGVSIEAARWTRSLHRLGVTTTRAAGHFYDHTEENGPDTDLLLPSLWRPAQPDGTLGPTPNPTTKEIQSLLHAVEDGVLIVDNAATLPTAPASMTTILDACSRAGIPIILRHHDPEWDSPSFRDGPSLGFPLDPPGAQHVAISTHVQTELRRRRGINSTVIHNAVDIDIPSPGTRHTVRTQRGFRDDDIVLLHPVTPYPRKNTEAAIRFASEVALLSNRRVIYWLTGATDNTARPQGEGVVLATGRCHNPSDMYAAADAVLLPSLWEGWGNPVAEAAYLDLPVLTAAWPALDDMRNMGLRDTPIDSPSAAAALLNLIEASCGGHDLEALRARLSPDLLDQHLHQLLTRAANSSSSHLSDSLDTVRP